MKGNSFEWVGKCKDNMKYRAKQLCCKPPNPLRLEFLELEECIPVSRNFRGDFSRVMWGALESGLGTIGMPLWMSDPSTAPANMHGENVRRSEGRSVENTVAWWQNLWMPRAVALVTDPQDDPHFWGSTDSHGDQKCPSKYWVPGEWLKSRTPTGCSVECES